MCDLFGGPSDQEKSLEAESQGLSASLSANYQTRFGEQENTINQLNSEINQIRSGNTGPGFGADELAARRAEIQNNAAAGVRNAQQVAENQGAGEVFGGADNASGLRSSIRDQITGKIASEGNILQSSEMNNLMAADYAQGRANAQATVGGLSTLAGIENPLGYASEAGKMTGQAFSQADKINQENIQRSQSIFGLIGKGIGLATGGLMGGFGNLDTTGSSTGGEQFWNFAQGAMGGGGGGGSSSGGYFGDGQDDGE